MAKKDDYNLSYADVVSILGRTERTIQRYIKQGRLTKQKVLSEEGTLIRFSESEVNRLKEELLRNGSQPRGDTTSRQVVAFQMAMVTFKDQLEKTEQRLQEKEAMISQLNRELGKLEGQMRRIDELKEALRTSEELRKRELIRTTIIYAVVIILSFGAFALLPLIQRLISQ